MTDDVLDVSAPPADPTADDLTTAQELRARLSGKDKAYVKLKHEHESIRAEREALARQLEDMRESMREYEERAAQAERDALSLRYPHAVAYFDDGPLPPAEKLAALERDLSRPAEDFDEPLTDPNQPPRFPRREKPLSEMTTAELRERLRATAPDSIEDVESW